VENVGGLVDDDGAFGRCDDSFVDEDSSEGDVRD
jgi:hypothetical protein